ncbi:S9 family peptidase [Allokutzneria sp. NRRL B-24872]|uniref:alpha/beta hydrolase family protein n=1 Tax=Allokutzneria sp. NRRL B-24872 TaxID=1137961 RepID=UPI000A36C483|nr:alpha/beta fold hydrolase [Allokutzneria sp. NRRL B-24872]
MNTSPTVSRINVRFSPEGGYATCVATDDDGCVYMELWALGAQGPRCQGRWPITTHASTTLALPLDDGRVLMTYYYRPDGQSFALLHNGMWTKLGSRTPPNLRLLPAPPNSGQLVGCAVSAPQDGKTTLYRINSAEPWLEAVCTLPTTLVGGVVAGSDLLFTAMESGQRTPVLIDPFSGRSVLPTVSRSCAAVIATGEVFLLAEGNRLSLALLDGETPMWTIPEPGDLGGSVTPVALDPTASFLALVVNRGARSGLVLLDVRDGSVREVDVPPCTLGTRAAWTSDGLWITASTPSRPEDFLWIPDPSTVRWSQPEDAWARGRVETFSGPAGPIEAVVHGPDWRESETVVLALHGGPADQWRLGFDRFFQSLAAAGVSVVAINQRGSTGYGTAHAEAIVNDWGGPDLQDVLAVGESLHSERGEPPVLYGVSYGAHLALLAAAVRPDAWSSCVAVAPFASAKWLYAETTDAVRAMIDRLGGRSSTVDLIPLAPAISVPVLLVHGALDESIPVGQSRALADRVPGITYYEVPGRGHFALGDAAADPVTSTVVAFVAGPTNSPTTVGRKNNERGGHHGARTRRSAAASR